MQKRTLEKRLRGLAAGLLALCALGFSGAALADLARYPLFLQQQIQPNVMFTLDNSGSMAWETLTGFDIDTASYASGRTSLRAVYSSAFNKIYYDPNVTYTPPLNYDGTSMGAASTTSASSDAYPTAGATKYNVNLKESCYALTTPVLPQYSNTTFAANTTNCKSAYSASTPTYSKLVARYAFYYVWNGSTAINTAAPGNTAFPTRVDIRDTAATYTNSGGRTECPNTCSYDQEIQNFANWFTYYRTRIMMAKASMGAAFAGIDPIATTDTPKFRVGFNAINSGGSSNTSVSDSSGSWLAIRRFDSGQKQNFFNKLYQSAANGGTPLRTQMDRIGKMYKGTLNATLDTNSNPFYKDISASPADKTLVPCRASYHIMTTDGYWNDSFTGIGDQDSSCSTGTTCYSTSARGSYDANAASNTLSDIALNYYKNDLRTTLDNKVPKSDDDPPGISDDEKQRQRMVTFTVGMGADGQRVYDKNYETQTSGDFYDIKQGTKSWPAPSGDTASTIDDLWHAAVNGRGKYFKATNSTEVRESLVEALKKIEQVTRTASTETANSSVISTGTIQYEPSFISGLWAGSLRAYQISLADDGAESWTLQWNAAAKLPAHGSRNIVTMKEDGSKVNFLWDQISTAQKTTLGTIDVLNYLRGDGSKEKANGGAFRDRQSKVDDTLVVNKLGDIVNSSPLFVENGVDQGYSTLPTIGTAYTPNRGERRRQRVIIYVGGYDRMLHAFDETVGQTDSGKELYAFVPPSVYTYLKELSSNTYDHRYFVDGPVTEGDAYLGAWTTVLLGSPGAGAKSVFAVDIKTPASMGASSVMWEATGSDIGNVLGEAKVALLNNDTWVAIFGNGYNSTGGTAKLMLRNLSSGTEYKTVGTDSTTGNGLSAPALVYDRQNRVVAAYAGDLQGRLWKFDLSVPATPTAMLLFTAATGQPIVQRPVYKQHPKGGYMVMFGTGKYFDTTDGGSSDVTVQSLYGIWDKPSASMGLTRANLQEQVMTDTTGGATLAMGSTVVSSPRGWFVDLKTTGGTGDPHKGERAIADPVILDDVFITKSLIPMGTLCSEGGDSFLYGLNYLTGGVNSPPSFNTLNVVKLGGGGTAGLQVVQIDGKVYVRTKQFSGTGTPPDKPRFTSVSPGYRTWRQIPVRY